MDSFFTKYCRLRDSRKRSLPLVRCMPCSVQIPPEIPHTAHADDSSYRQCQTQPCAGHSLEGKLAKTLSAEQLRYKARALAPFLFKVPCTRQAALWLSFVATDVRNESSWYGGVTWHDNLSFCGMESERQEGGSGCHRAY